MQERFLTYFRPVVVKVCVHVDDECTAIRSELSHQERQGVLAMVNICLHSLWYA